MRSRSRHYDIEKGYHADVVPVPVPVAAGQHIDTNDEIHAALDGNYKSQVTKTLFVVAVAAAAAAIEEVFDENGIVVVVVVLVDDDPEMGEDMVFD